LLLRIEDIVVVQQEVMHILMLTPGAAKWSLFCSLPEIL